MPLKIKKEGLDVGMPNMMGTRLGEMLWNRI
jgi:hypothetical protein